MFHIKICGITTPEDALDAAACGADALGLNFYSRSVRFLPPAQATEIAVAVRSEFPTVQLVGVGVNATLDEVRQITAGVSLDAWQLHGDESPEFLVKLAVSLPQLRLIRAFRCRNADLTQEAAYLQSCRTLGRLPDAVLVDAYAPSAYGGTGRVVDWHAVQRGSEQLFHLPLVLAGGLTPENVAVAIQASQADAVDVASGVEVSPGRKDPDKVRDFISEAKRAFGLISR